MGLVCWPAADISELDGFDRLNRVSKRLGMQSLFLQMDATLGLLG